MADNAAEPYSKDASTSAEKEDEDHITVPMARIGKAFTPGAVQPTQPVVQPTQPVVQPTEPVKVMLGDADKDGHVTIIDVTAIQRVLAEINVPVFDEAAADVDGDGEITIDDATWIQRALVGIKTPYDIPVEIDW